MPRASRRRPVRAVNRLRALVLVSSLIGLVALPAAGTGIVVPAYFYPSWWDSEANQWDELTVSAGQVSLVAIMNPDSGPGSGVNSDYTHEVDALRAAGGRVIGYVPTTYGNRPLGEVLSDVDVYYAWYGIDGIYFDETTADADAGHLAYYQSCYDYVRGLDAGAVVILGQGTASTQDYATRSTQLLVHEADNAVLPFVEWTPAPWTAPYGADRFSVLAYNVADAAAMRAAVDHAVANDAGWVYFTDDGGTNPWDSLPGYWLEEVDYVAQAGSGSGLISLDDETTITLTRRSSFRKRTVKFRSRVTNVSSAALPNPLLLVIESIDDPSVTVRDADGTTEDGRPFFDLTANIPGAALDPGERTSRLNLVFNNPSRTAFAFQARVYHRPAAPGAARPVATLEGAGHQVLAPSARLANSPNPFNAATQITYQLSEPAATSLGIHNLLGQRSRLLVQGFQNAGTHQVTWDGKDDGGQPVSSGIYIYRLTSGSVTESRMMLLMK